MGVRKERPARSYGKTGASWFCEARRCPRTMVKLWNSLNHFYFLKREGGQDPVFLTYFTIADILFTSGARLTGANRRKRTGYEQVRPLDKYRPIGRPIERA